MHVMEKGEIEQISGGNPLVIAGAIVLALEISDIAYNAAKAFQNGYNANDQR